MAKSNIGGGFTAVFRDAIAHFRVAGTTSSSTNTLEQEEKILAIPKDAILEAGYMAIDYGPRSAVAQVTEFLIAPAETGEIPTIATLIERHWWYHLVIMMGTEANLLKTSDHEESAIVESVMVPKVIIGSPGIFLYSISNIVGMNYLVAGRLEYRLTMFGQYFSDTYTRKGEKFTDGWEGYDYEETIDIEESNDQ